ncbi:MAG: twin-arginine translocation signal domain-containing protein [Bacteroidia bacterium]
MKRRDFIKRTGLATTAAVAFPYLLPSGRLFAATGARKANHVVFCLYAGGVRNLESIHKQDGNLMTSILNGNETISSDILPGLQALPSSPLGLPLQNYGTLFKEFRYASGPTGHYNGHITAITGAYTQVDLNIKANPDNPTVFELYRKHNSPQQTALNSWWISNTIGPYVALNYSTFPGYGAAYGANFICPNMLISQGGYDVLGNMQNFSSNEQAIVNNMRDFLDKNFASQYVEGNAGVTNTIGDTYLLQNYITDAFNKAITGQYTNPWLLPDPSVMSGDMYNIFFAEEILKQFKPELLVVNMQDVDICHSNFTAYANNLRKADYSVAHLWNTIQNTPGLANDTILIVAPEHGRNLNANNILDPYGRNALDHTSDPTSREIFCLIVGPPSVVKQGVEINTVTGESIDIVPTIANILGFDTNIPGGLLTGTFLNQAFF